jgi:hypothetical protein
VPLTSGVCAAICALCWSSVGAPAAQPVDTLTVHLKLGFDPSITSKMVKDVVREEAAAIWKPYGVDLVWSAEADDSAPLHYDVAIVRQGGAAGHRVSEPVLGRTVLNPQGVVRGPIRIFLDSVDALLDELHGGNPWLHDPELARALGRVLAHELGHVLLGPPRYHDAEGLMRTKFTSEDLGRVDRTRFKLAARSVERLQSEMQRTRASQACSQTTTDSSGQH